jgi:hypothetical protein
MLIDIDYEPVPVAPIEKPWYEKISAAKVGCGCACAACVLILIVLIVIIVRLNEITKASH